MLWGANPFEILNNLNSRQIAYLMAYHQQVCIGRDVTDTLLGNLVVLMYNAHKSKNKPDLHISDVLDRDSAICSDDSLLRSIIRYFQC